MSLKILAILVLFVLCGVLASVHGYVSADRRLHPVQPCPQSLPLIQAEGEACALGACSDAPQGIECEAQPEVVRPQRRAAFHARRRIASNWDALVSEQPTVSDS
jgi:hypothetical protein